MSSYPEITDPSQLNAGDCIRIRHLGGVSSYYRVAEVNDDHIVADSLQAPGLQNQWTFVNLGLVTLSNGWRNPNRTYRLTEIQARACIANEEHARRVHEDISDLIRSGAPGLNYNVLRLLGLGF